MGTGRIEEHERRVPLGRHVLDQLALGRIDPQRRTVRHLGFVPQPVICVPYDSTSVGLGR